MDENGSDSNENPLDELASQLSNALDSNSVSVNDFSADNIEGGQIQMDSSVARTVQGQAVHMEESAVGLLKADVVDISDGMVGFLNAREVSGESVSTIGLVAQDVQADDIFSVILLAGRVDGKVRAVFTPVTALAMGVGLGFAFFITKRILGRIWPFRRRQKNVS